MQPFMFLLPVFALTLVCISCQGQDVCPEPCQLEGAIPIECRKKEFSIGSDGKTRCPLCDSSLCGSLFAVCPQITCPNDANITAECRRQNFVIGSDKITRCPTCDSRVCGVFYMTSCVSSAYTAYDAMNLQSALASNYSAKVRPSESTSVDVSFGMMHITELNIVNQQLHIVGFLMVVWKDNRLTWTPSDYGNIDFLFIRLSDIWSPPLVLNNAADKIQMINDDSDLASLNVYVYETGFVIWLAPANFMAHCTINIRYYPFDSQTCSFVVSSWMFTEKHLNVIATTSSINLDLYEENGEWDVTKSTVDNATRTLLGNRLPAVKFTTYLTRKYSYYLMNMLLPVIVLAIMAPFVFMLPVESGEKIGYALTILLSLSVVMTLVSESIPPTSTHICVLSVYLLLTFIICSLETLLTVVTCRLHDFHMKGFTMGSKLQYMTRLLAIITRSSQILKDNNTTEITPNDISSEISELRLKEKDHLDKEIMKARALIKDENGGVTTNGSIYSFEDFVYVFDKFNFFLFEIITIIVTVVIMVVLRVGGAT